MSDVSIPKAIEKITKIADSIDYQYMRLEILNENQSFILEKNKKKPIGFKAGGTNE